MSTLHYKPLADLALRLKAKFGLDTAIETGTYQGTGPAWLASNFNHVCTIEIDEVALAGAESTLIGQDLTNIAFMLGDSRDTLREVVSELKGPALFWLDAHNASQLFGPGPDNCPVLDELDTIFASPYSHCILIDDAHCFVPPLPYDPAVWPEMWRLKKLARDHGFLFGVAHDVMAILPPLAEAEMAGFVGGGQTVVGIDPVPRRRLSANLLRFGAGGLKVRATMVQGPAPGEPMPDPAVLPVQITELAKTSYGQMLLPMHDTNQTPPLRYGGYALSYREIHTLVELIQCRPPGAIFLDVGANVGTFGFAMQPYCAKVYMIEPQRIIYNMLCGSIALNGWLNVYAYNLAVSDKAGFIEVPQYDYTKVCSFGSIEFGSEQIEPLQQERGNDPSKVELRGDSDD